MFKVLKWSMCSGEGVRWKIIVGVVGSLCWGMMIDNFKWLDMVYE